MEKEKQKKKPKKKPLNSSVPSPPKRKVKVVRNTEAETQEKNIKSEQLKAEKRKLRKELRELSKRRRAVSKLPKSVQQTIPYLADYDNGIFEIEKTKEGSRYSISFAFEDINYDTIKPEDARTIFLRYVDLHNIIPSDADLSISVASINQDKDRMMEEIRISDRRDGFNELRHEMNEILRDNVSKGNNFLARDRYITLTLEAANPVEAVSKFARMEPEILNTLKRIGTVGKRLTTLERLFLLHNIYNLDKVGELEKLDLDYKEIQKYMVNMKDYICPEGFRFRDNIMKIGNMYARYMIINEFPRTMSDRFLGELTDMQFNMVITINIHPVPMADAIKLVNKQILGMEANKQEGQKQAIRNGYSPDMINHNLKDALDDALELRDDITNQNQKLFEATFNLLIFGETEEKLKANTEAVKTVANKHLCPLLTPHYLQEEGLKQALPLGHSDKIDRKRTLTTESTAIFIPFVSQDLMQKRGFYYGRNTINNRMIMFNRLTLQNANGFILGMSGAGKSFSAKREIVNILLNTNDEVLVIDPDGEYIPFTKQLDGEHIIISPTSSMHFNPMDMNQDYAIADTDKKTGNADPLIGKCDFLISVVDTAISNNNPDFSITPIQRSLIDRCVRHVYADYIDSGYDTENIPTLKELQRTFRLQGTPEAVNLADAFELFTDGSLSVFAHKTNVDITNRFVVYDISSLGKNLASLGSLIMLDAIWNHVLENRKKGIRTWLFVDEFTVLLRKASAKEFFLDTFKRIRKVGGACTGITQNITSLFRDEDAMEMLANAEFIYLLNQSPSDKIPLAEILNMSDAQLEYISDAEKGSGLIKAGRHIVPFKDDFPKNTQLYRCMTTDLEERKVIDKLGQN